jgi:hypothetical protein
VEEIRILSKKMGKDRRYLEEKKEKISKLRDRYEQKYAKVAAIYDEGENEIKTEAMKVERTLRELLQDELAELQHAVSKLNQWLAQAQARLDKQQQQHE